MSKLTDLKNSLKKYTPSIVGGGLFAVAGSSFAVGTVATGVSTALEDGQATMTAIAGGLVLMAVVMLGLGLTLKALQR